MLFPAAGDSGAITKLPRECSLRPHQRRSSLEKALSHKDDVYQEEAPKLQTDENGKQYEVIEIFQDPSKAEARKSRDITGRATVTNGRDFGEFIPSEQHNRDRAAACRCDACTRCQPYGAKRWDGMSRYGAAGGIT